MSDVLGGATDAAPEPDGGDAAVLPEEAVADDDLTDDAVAGDPSAPAAKRRRRGTRGGRGRNRTRVSGNGAEAGEADGDGDDAQPELPDRPIEGKVQSPEVAERVLVRRP